MSRAGSPRWKGHFPSKSIPFLIQHVLDGHHRSSRTKPERKRVCPARTIQWWRLVTVPISGPENSFAPNIVCPRAPLFSPAKRARARAHTRWFRFLLLLLQSSVLRTRDHTSSSSRGNGTVRNVYRTCGTSSPKH